VDCKEGLTMIDVQKLARDADPFGEDGRLFYLAAATPETLERFAALVLEEAAKVCDDIWQEDGTAMQCRAAIRSLKPKGEE
jgi:DNA-directed RNA polymerase subunit F